MGTLITVIQQSEWRDHALLLKAKKYYMYEIFLYMKIVAISHVFIDFISKNTLSFVLDLPNRKRGIIMVSIEYLLLINFTFII